MTKPFNLFLLFLAVKLSGILISHLKKLNMLKKRQKLSWIHVLIKSICYGFFLIRIFFLRSKLLIRINMIAEVFNVFYWTEKKQIGKAETQHIECYQWILLILHVNINLTQILHVKLESPVKVICICCMCSIEKNPVISIYQSTSS